MWIEVDANLPGRRKLSKWILTRLVRLETDSKTKCSLHRFSSGFNGGHTLYHFGCSSRKCRETSSRTTILLSSLPSSPIAYLVPLDHQQTHSHFHPLNLLPKTLTDSSRILSLSLTSPASTSSILSLAHSFVSPPPQSPPIQNRYTTKPRHTVWCRLYLLRT